MISKKESKETKETLSKKNKKEEAKKNAAPADASVADNTLDNDGRVGTMLRETRLQKGEEIEDISRKLHIRPNYLEAIENSHYSEVPEAPYGPGFVRSYADYLGLNAVRMAQLYKEETDAQNAQSDMYVPEPESEATAPSYKYILISLIAIAIAYFGWNYYISQTEQTLEDVTTENSMPAADEQDFTLQVEEIENQTPQEVSTDSIAKPEAKADVKKDEVAENQPQKEEAENTEQETSVKTPATPTEAASKAAEKAPAEDAPKATLQDTPKAEVKETPKAEETSEPKPTEKAPTPASIDTDVKVVMKANQETWIEAKDADKLYISKVVQAGYTYNVPDKEGMIISAGRYDAVDVYVNGKLTPVFTANKKTGIKVDEVLEQAEND